MQTSDQECAVSAFAVAVLRYCKETAGSVTSWIRSPAHNRAVGGVSDSYHLDGLAVDVVGAYPSATDQRHAIAAKYNLKLVVESDHDHLQWRF